MKVKHIDSSVKEKFRAQRSVKKVMLKVFWGMKGLKNVQLSTVLLIANSLSNISHYLLNDPLLPVNRSKILPSYPGL